MSWILLDVALVLGVTAVLVVVSLGLWRRVRALGAAVGVAGDQLAAVSAQLDTVSARERPDTRPTPAGHVAQAPRPPRGVRSNRSS